MDLAPENPEKLPLLVATAVMAARELARDRDT